MPKPNDKFTLAQMKDYIKKHNLNKGKNKILLGHKKPLMVSKLKNAGHWEAEVKPIKHPPIPPNIKGKKITPKPKGDKDLFMGALNVMTMVAKEKDKKTKEEVDEDVKISKKKSVSFNELYDHLLADDDYMDEEYERRDNIQEGYNMEYFIHQRLKLPNKDEWDELTDRQQDKLRDIYENESRKDNLEYVKEIWKKHIKGKKFKNVKSLKKTFMDNYD